MLTEDKRKFLTEKVLGECRHTFIWIPGGGLQCKNCNIDLYGEGNYTYEQVLETPKPRTFTTVQDRHDVFKALGKIEKWNGFIDYIDSEDRVKQKHVIPHTWDKLMQWLCIKDEPEHIEMLMELVCEFMEGKQ